MAFSIMVNGTITLPYTVKFSPPMDGDVTLVFSGTCWSNTAAIAAGIAVALDGKNIGYASLFFNQASVHMTLPTQFYPVNLSDGTHSITLSAANEYTVVDVNDNFGLWILSA